MMNPELEKLATEVAKSLCEAFGPLFSDTATPVATPAESAANQSDLQKTIDELTASNAGLLNVVTQQRERLNLLNQRLIEANAERDKLRDQVNRSYQPELNKLHKNLRAEQNRTASYAKTIAGLQSQVAALKAELQEARSKQPVQVETVIIDGVSWSRDEIISMRDYNLELIDYKERIERSQSGENPVVFVRGVPYTREAIVALQTRVADLEGQVQTLSRTSATIRINDKYMTAAQVEKKLDAATKALRAFRNCESTLKRTQEHLAAERKSRHALEDELNTLRKCKEYVSCKDTVIDLNQRLRHAEESAVAYAREYNSLKEKFKTYNVTTQVAMKNGREAIVDVTGNTLVPTTITIVDPTNVMLRSGSARLTGSELQAAVRIFREFMSGIITYNGEVYKLSDLGKPEDSKLQDELQLLHTVLRTGSGKGNCIEIHVNQSRMNSRNETVNTQTTIPGMDTILGRLPCTLESLQKLDEFARNAADRIKAIRAAL